MRKNKRMRLSEITCETLDVDETRKENSITLYMGAVAASSVIALTEEAICHAHYYGASDIKSNREFCRTARTAVSTLFGFGLSRALGLLVSLK